MLKNYGNSRGWGVSQAPPGMEIPGGRGLKQKCLPWGVGGGGWGVVLIFSGTTQCEKCPCRKNLTKYISFTKRLSLFVHLRYVHGF